MAIFSYRRSFAYVLFPMLGFDAPGVRAQSFIGEISYAPFGATATSVPTLSEWGLMAMVGLLALVAYRVLRERLQGKSLAAVVLAGVLGLGIVAGGHWGRTVLAAVVNLHEFSEPPGGVVGFTVSGLHKVTNVSGVPQKITGMVVHYPLDYAFSEGAEVPVCTVGMVVPVGGVCNFRIGVLRE